MATEKTIGTRGRTFIGIVVSAKMQKTVTVEWDRRRYVPKYERYLKARTRVKAHNPDDIDAKEGDVVRITECRPISKTKNFVIVEKLGKDYLKLEKAHKAQENVEVKKEAIAHESSKS